MARIIFFSIFFLSVYSLPALGADAKKQLQGIRKEIQEKKQLINRTIRVENVVSGEIAKIDKNLKDKNASLVALNKDLMHVDNNLKQTGKNIEVLLEDIDQRKGQIRKRLVSVYKGGYAGELSLFFSSDTFPRLQENTRYMRAVLEKDRKMLAEHNSKINTLQNLQGKLQKEAYKKEQIKTSIELKKDEIEAEKRRKGEYLEKVRGEKKNYQASLQKLEADSKRLQSVVSRLEAISRKRAAEEKKASVKINRKEKVTQKPELPPSPDKGFKSQKGHLSMPLRGRILSGFGRHKHPTFNSYTISNGISISAQTGADVHSIYDGKVIYAGYFKGYGNLVIVDHGGGYFSLYAHNSRVHKNVGAAVSKNEVVASVGDLDSANGPMLYFEIRYQGRPVDPAHWVR